MWQYNIKRKDDVGLTRSKHNPWILDIIGLWLRVLPLSGGARSPCAVAPMKGK